jgi:hypothetical protein
MTKAREESEEQREARLIKARKQAAKSREEKMVEKYKDKVLEKVGGRPKRDEDKASANRPVRDESESEDEDEDEEAPKKPLKPVKEPKPIKEEVKEEEEKPKTKPKPKAKPKAKVIIEQSSDDEDTFEASKDVIFVKRVRAKPKVEQQHAPQNITPMPPPVTRQEQPLPQRFQQQQQQAPPPKPQMSQEKRLEMERYLNMTRGNFLPISRPR